MRLIKRTEAVSRINELYRKAYVGGQPVEVLVAYQKCVNALMSCRVINTKDEVQVKVIIQDTIIE